MLFNVYNQKEEVIGHVEADDIVEAWYLSTKIDKAAEDTILDVRPVVEREAITLPQGEITKSRVAGWLHSNSARIAYWLYDMRGLIASSEIEDTARAIEDIITEWRISHPT